DDLPAMLAAALAGRVRPGDVVAVTQKIVSKAEGRVVPEAERGHRGWVASETARVVARRDELVIAQTRHGFVCANAGVDASNVGEGFLTLLPEDPDASAARIRGALADVAGGEVGVVVTDTFGRAWRRGLVNVAIGSSGLPSLLDLRGGTDHTGRVLEATVVALADELAAASGLVMDKGSRVPVAILRPGEGRAWVAQAPDGATAAADLVRPPEEDLFRESPLQSLHARRSLRSFGGGEVPVAALEEAVRAACTAPAPHHTRPWLFVALTSDAAKRRLLAAMAAAWRDDLASDGTPGHVIERRLAKSDALLGAAPAIVVPFVRLRGSHTYPDDERASAEREMFLLAGGAGIQNLLLALHAQRLGSCWVSSTLFCKEETRDALGLPHEWIPLGSVAVGPMPAATPPDRPPLPVDDHLRVE
ncbi:MAG TPA: coenzyme F420-0:L-glutamate ligase, partial [Actinomycetota bacterium]|nr:coenzyme F420-0:L-glutamate ligase [Actinomycetota bacterium]